MVRTITYGYDRLLYRRPRHIRRAVDEFVRVHLPRAADPKQARCGSVRRDFVSEREIREILRGTGPRLCQYIFLLPRVGVCMRLGA